MPTNCTKENVYCIQGSRITYTHFIKKQQQQNLIVPVFGFFPRGSHSEPWLDIDGLRDSQICFSQVLAMASHGQY